MKPRIAEIRRLICRQCVHPCTAYQAAAIDHADPSVSCPERVWHVYHGEGGAERAPEVPSPSREEASRAAWAWLHLEALAGRLTPERLTKEFRPMIRRFGCACLKGWDAIIDRIRFRPGDQFSWSVEVHNAVSAELPAPKPQLTEDEARTIWTDVSVAQAAKTWKAAAR